MKRTVYNLLILGALCFTPALAFAQSLSEKLIAEDPGKLAIQARERGDIVRGAILFHQGNINCITCHRSSAETAGIGPDLRKLGTDATDAYIVESILEPSKTIKKGFETISILTVDGNIVSGSEVRADDQMIVIRTSEAIDRPIRLRRSEIERIQPGSQSTMPANLANELKDRQQFLDLLRYVLDLQQRGVEGTPHQTVASTNRSRELSDGLRGRVLVQQLNCGSCHQDVASNLLGKSFSGPNLKWSAQRLNPVQLALTIADPQRAKPGSRMPHMLGRFPPAQRAKVAEAIVHFLISLTGGNDFGSKPETEAAANSAVTGNELFHTVGCVACHSPRDKTAAELPLKDSIPLGELSGKYDHVSLAAFLEDPHQARPFSGMPNMRLAHREAINLASYLLQSQETAPSPVGSWEFDASEVALGKRYFAELGCANCHDGILRQPEDATLISTIAPPPKIVDLDRGCLTELPAGSQPNRDVPDRRPVYSFTKSERAQIQAAISQAGTSLNASDQVDATLVAFNCTACHSRDGLGGVDAERSPHFQTTNLNLGEQGRIPPSLSGVGAKLNEKWTRDVLVNGRSVRPYMKTRMPQFGERNIGHLVRLFPQTDELPPTEFAPLNNAKETRELGLKLAGRDGLNCVACHTFQFKIADTMPAVDLTEMSERLKKDWFYQYMLDPQRFSPNTVMPSFWPGGTAIRSDLAGEPKDQIEALWQYLLDGRQARPPRGVIREPLEVVVKSEARMLRRKYPGMNKRGIGVGYPGGVNLAFDAEQMRLGLIWKGRFIDPSGVWYGQGHGTVRPLGQPVMMPVGPDIDSTSQPWIVDDGRPPNHQFLGYELDSKRRPTLRYSYDDIVVADFFTEYEDAKTGKTQLRRRVTLSAPSTRDNIRFRVVGGVKVTRMPSGVYAVGDALEIRITSPVGPVLVGEANNQRLNIPLNLSAEEPLEIVIDYVW